MTLNNSMSITPSPPGQAKGAKFEHGSVLGGKTRGARVSSQWKSTGQKARSELARFPTTTRGLVDLSTWLSDAKVTHVAMEATGVYWKPVWQVLCHDFNLILANASHIRNVPGRKSDANDATWIPDLLAH